jgi:hypothetical protein
MALRPKPGQQPAQTPPADEQHINALIEKGGTVAATPSSYDDTRPMLVQLRLPRDIIARIDRHRKMRTVPPSRHAWILEALLEKLNLEQD